MQTPYLRQVSLYVVAACTLPHPHHQHPTHWTIKRTSTHEFLRLHVISTTSEVCFHYMSSLLHAQQLITAETLPRLHMGLRRYSSIPLSKPYHSVSDRQVRLLAMP